MGKSISLESREKTHYKQDSHICKICLPYMIPIGLSGSVVDFVYLELWQPLWSGE